ncbi:hypothetical protein BAE42_28925 [Mesorhizobium loti]|uniref:DUF2188 domain-containing protein n=1 Tax=Mesorhizobium erdmanii TaxID=1777866 RepID=A0A6M7UR48_9HYPH|nr:MULTISPECIES: hypothetical protein [Mesorhizobium]OBP78192.1 hypothetical protein BAE42_28925 [Mesorhizobium loti]OBQ68024.1 hypothetical protein A8146_11545 [Mesorhizobium loti]QKC79366.1 hypothetical protein EB233_31195 [Mesorhizobium erdmanii]
MVAGEPNDVRVKRCGGGWIVHTVQDGKLTVLRFKTQSPAEYFADAQRTRLGLAAKPPIDQR